MYEKIVEHFEKEYCVMNIYFRRNYKLFYFGIIGIVIIYFLMIYFIQGFNINNIILKGSLSLLIPIIIEISILYLILFRPIDKIYKQKLKGKYHIDWLGMFMKEEYIGFYTEYQTVEMEKYLKNDCKIKNTNTLDIIIDNLNEEIKEKYYRKDWKEKYIGTLLTIVIFVLTIYFSNNNVKEIITIISLTIVAIIMILISSHFICSYKNINLTPVDKRENMLDLKDILIDIKLKWSINENRTK